MTKEQFFNLAEKYDLRTANKAEQTLIEKFCQDVQVQDISEEWSLSQQHFAPKHRPCQTRSHGHKTFSKNVLEGLTRCHVGAPFADRLTATRGRTGRDPGSLTDDGG